MAVKAGGSRASIYKLSTDTSVAATVVQDAFGSAGVLYQVQGTAGGAATYLRFYDDSAAVAGTTEPKVGFLVASGATFSCYVVEGIPFTSAFAYNATANSCDPADTGAVAAGSWKFIFK